jgi:signal transduction histidine kinase
LLDSNTKTGFKIGGSIGIIILLLGIAILFGIYQMSQVSQEIIEISEEYTPLYVVLSDIRHHQSNQALNFEKIIRYEQIRNQEGLEKAKEEFWFSGGIIEADIARGTSIVNTGYDMAISEKARNDFMIFSQQISEIGQIHFDYENLVRDSIQVMGDVNFAGEYLGEINEKESQLQNEIVVMTKEISLLIDESTKQIEENESTALLGQVIIISIVGAMAATLGFFLSQINKDLKNEVDLKTTELRRANEKLKKLDKMKDEFIGIASHELKSPIQPIMGFAELAKSGDIDNEEAWDGVSVLAKKLQDLANDILDVSRIDSNRLVLHKEKLRINDLILDVVNSMKVNLKEGVKIYENLDENIEMEVDRVRFEQVMRNLLNNAIKFTNNGIIHIATHVNLEERNLMVIVSDSGLGIPVDILPNVFGKFVTKGHAQENQNGTGLGLFLCKGIIQAHGGEIFAKNNNGNGAIFEFTIPIAQKILESQEALNK